VTDADGFEPAADPALRPVEDHEHQARDHRRDGEREVDQAVSQGPAPELVADQDDRKGEAKDGVDHGRQHGDP
jgi:hypothetical protein